MHCCSVTKLCTTLLNPTDCVARQASLSLTISWSLPKFMAIDQCASSQRSPLLSTFKWCSDKHWSNQGIMMDWPAARTLSGVQEPCTFQLPQAKMTS